VGTTGRRSARTRCRCRAWLVGWVNVKPDGILIATGPSLTVEDVELARSSNLPILVVNDAYRLVPDADLVYACDAEWWDRYHADVVVRTGDAVLWTTNKDAADKYRLHHIPGNHHDAPNGVLFDVSGHGITYGGNSGFQLINLAFVLGYRSLVLLGYDMGHASNEPKHFFGAHPAGLEKPSPYGEWMRTFHKAAPIMKAAGMRIVNASRKTRLECFERTTIDKVLL
jgi:hypothetical protein